MEMEPFGMGLQIVQDDPHSLYHAYPLPWETKQRAQAGPTLAYVVGPGVAKSDFLAK